MTTGEAPDLTRPPAPLDLPRLVMRRAAAAALVCLALALALGLMRAHDDTADELAGGLALARVSRELAALPGRSDAQALAALPAAAELRHLRLDITDEHGRALLPEPPSAPPGWALRLLMALDWRSADTGAPQTVSWPVERSAGRWWTVSLTASPESEQREALSNLLGLFTLLAGCCALLLAVMHGSLRRAFRPLQGLLGAIAQVERQDASGLRNLPSMPIRELDAIAHALRHLAGALQQAEDARRLLIHRLFTLQEDERQRLARDLHDEFGQRLTALRVDAAWLARRLAADAELGAVAAGMGAQCAHIQQDVRGLLARLRPVTAEADTPAQLAGLLQGLVDAWSGRGRPAITLHCSPAFLAVPTLPRALVLALHRITQEALTNVARHASASRATVTLDLVDGVLDWSVGDDGSGIADPAVAFHQGNGLAGVQERVWALGGEFSHGPASTSAPPAPARAAAAGPSANGDGDGASNDPDNDNDNDNDNGNGVAGAARGWRLAARLPLARAEGKAAA